MAGSFRIFTHVTVIHNVGAIHAKVMGVINDERRRVLKDFIEDANYYCREQTGATKKSAITDSDYEQGIAKWTTPYANRVYWTGEPATNVNPNASLMWAHKAMELNRKKYEDMFNTRLGTKR